MNDAAPSARGTLWLVATPIGTMEDLSPRAREVLGEVDLILAEDTRRTRGLLGRLGIPAGRRLLSFNEQNEARRIPGILERLASGASVALVSDAGTPVLSDPGFLLIREARARGLAVLSVPGPSAFTAALAASGLPPLPATLAGFLPPRAGARRRALERLAGAPGTLVLLVSPHRLGAELADAAAVLGADRPAALVAEVSKLHERAVNGTLAELAACREAEAPRGEYVLVVGPPPEERPEPGAAEASRAYEEALAEGHPRPEALRRAARHLGISRRRLYALLEEARGAAAEQEPSGPGGHAS